MKPFTGEMVTTVLAWSGFQTGDIVASVRHGQLNSLHWAGNASWITQPLPGLQCVHYLPAGLSISGML